MTATVPDAATRADLIAFLANLPSGAAPDPARATSARSKGGVFGGWRDDAPGRVYRISPSDLPSPAPETSANNPSRIVPRPKDAWPRVPSGFRVSLFAQGMTAPRMLQTAPNGDVFVTETDANRIRVLRPGADGRSARSNEIFAEGLAEPFGMAFYPQGPHPRWLYVAETNRIVRYAYTPGALRAAGPPEVVVARLSPTSAGHSNRDLAVSLDGRAMYTGIGSASNVADNMSRKPLAQAQAIQRREGLGATWDEEAGRARVVAFAPEVGRIRPYATGLRNCSGIAVQPRHGAVWCSTNERDRLGDDLVPDYVTRVPEGAFFGWPWWYIGDHEDPRLAGERPDLRGRVAIPDVLLQPHSASMGISFAEGARLPARWRGSAFVAEHGSWNRAQRTGPKLIRIPVDAAGAPTGEYEDVMTGFVLDEARVWGRPVSVAVAKDGALLIADDAGGVVWRLDYVGDAKAKH
ncbi:sorbosone dehydrogenase family protein [Luteimonas gilva]|uniref:Sorbosone dehydrogenase family protein n=2 Tax=Luteimonas gilva TaxID=2572684 RepID=A0A4U5JXD1_9GAMM|nr:sorbosone dehydrogenase family protein [Luteimonas gilva]